MCGTLHTNNLMQKCGITNMIFESINEFIAKLFCENPNEHSFYLKACISKQCIRCGNFSLLVVCFHETSEHIFGQQLVDVKRFKNIEYALKDENVRKCVDLIIEKISMHTFMDDFKSKILHKYVQHSQHARWLDRQFHLCRNIFSVGTILSVVYFIENYTLSP